MEMRLQFCLLLGLARTIEALELVCCVLADVGDEVVDLATTLITDWSVVLVFRQPEQSWEASDIEGRWNVVGGSVHLDDGNVFALKLLTQLIEDWSEFLAVSWNEILN